MASYENLRRYQQKKFNRYKELNDIKTKNDEAYIFLKIKDMESVLSEFSSDERPSLKNEFYDLIESKASYIPLDLPLVLTIQENNLTSSEKILIRKLIKNYFELKKITHQIKEDSIIKKARVLLTVGILCICFNFILWNVKSLSFLNDMISIMASFSIWEFGSIMLYNHDEIKEDIIKYNHLSQTRIIFEKET